MTEQTGTVADGSGLAASTDQGLLAQAAHLVIVVIAFFLFAISLGFVVGFFWYAFMLRRTGRRARDILFNWVPIFGLITIVSTLWRATSKDVYWSTRLDLSSEPNAAWSSPVRWFKEIRLRRRQGAACDAAVDQCDPQQRVATPAVSSRRLTRRSWIVVVLAALPFVSIIGIVAVKVIGRTADSYSTSTAYQQREAEVCQQLAQDERTHRTDDIAELENQAAGTKMADILSMVRGAQSYGASAREVARIGDETRQECAWALGNRS